MKLRKLDIQTRRQKLEAEHGPIDGLPLEQVQWTDHCVENAVGAMGIPLGLATGFVIDGESLMIPMATEEPSVIAAASFAATVISRQGGFVTEATDPVMAFEVVIEDSQGDLARQLQDHQSELEQVIMSHLTSMEKRGGGFKCLSLSPIEGMSALRLLVDVDVRDAQGANLLNTCAEAVANYLRESAQVSVLMAIVCNGAEKRRASASCQLSPEQVTQLCQQRYPAKECLRRLSLAGQLAQHDRQRAVTHNKGIMNGITALALATGNDTRALEAAVHAWAAREGVYHGLSTFTLTEQGLQCHLDLPLPLATVGGLVQTHSTSRFSLNVLGQPNGPRLARIAAALGLAQNIAALAALVSAGIQAGHMPLHAKKEQLRDS